MLSRSCSQKSLLVVLVTVVRDPPPGLLDGLPAPALPPEPPAGVPLPTSPLTFTVELMLRVTFT